MTKQSGYRYLLLLGSNLLGPYDRRTIVGMRIKKLIDNEMRLRRSDGHEMSVAQLLADRFEMTDVETLRRQSISPPASGIWPTFLVDFGGGLMKKGALGFQGRGELRFQGDHLRLTGPQKSGLIGSTTHRIKLPLALISRAQIVSKSPKVLCLVLKPGLPYHESVKSLPALLRLDDSEAAVELLEMMNLEKNSQ